MILSLVKSGNMSFEMFLRWKWSQGQNHGHNMYQSKSAVVHNYFCWPGLICGHAFFREPRYSDASSSGSWDCPPHGFRSRWGSTQVSFSSSHFVFFPPLNPSHFGWVWVFDCHLIFLWVSGKTIPTKSRPGLLYQFLTLSAIYRATYSVYKDQTSVPCKEGQNLMSPAVGTLRL